MKTDPLLPPMDEDDFISTDFYDMLIERDDVFALIRDFLNVNDVDDLSYVPNPRYYYTAYDKDDFDEVWDYLRYGGKTERKPLPADLQGCFLFKHAPVGDYVVYRKPKGSPWGILNKKT